MQSLVKGQSVGGFDLSLPLATRDTVLSNTVSALLDEGAIGGSPPRLLLDSASNYLAAHLLVRYGAVRRGVPRPRRMADWQLRKVFDFMDAHLDQNISLDRMAAEVGMSAHYFCRAFRVSLGTSPHRYMLMRRIDHAKAQLISSDQAITAIAIELGFSSHAHFSNIFKRMPGYAPSAYRAALARIPH